MNKDVELGFMTLSFIVNAAVSKGREDQEDCIFQLGQAKGMWFALKMLGFNIEEMKDAVLEQARKEEFMPESKEAKAQVKQVIEMFQSVHQDVVNHVDQIIGGMLLDDAQR